MDSFKYICLMWHLIFLVVNVCSHTINICFSRNSLELSTVAMLYTLPFIAGSVGQERRLKPPGEVLANRNDHNARGYLAQWLVSGCWGEDCHEGGKPNSNDETEYEGYDGFYNNMAKPDLGAIDTPLLRRVPAVYADGVYQPATKNRPNPLVLSEQLMSGNIGNRSNTGKSALLVYFGQQVVEEILDAQRPSCPPEYFNIDIPMGHKYREESGLTIMPVLRTRFDMNTGLSPNNPRQQLNEITPWIDGGLVYGTSKTWSDVLRTDEDGNLVPHGELASSAGGLFPALNKQRLPMANPPPPFYHSTHTKRHSTDPVERFFKLGNPRGNENPFLLTFGILWFRWHNKLARELHELNPEWTDEKVYNEARKWVIATQQHITVNTWLPQLLGEPLPDYNGYDPSINPQIDQFFQSAAFRFGHTLVTPGVYIRDYARNGCKVGVLGDKFKTVRTCQHYWRPHESITRKYNNETSEFVDIDRLLMGMAMQMCEREDNVIVEDLRGRVFGPLEFSRRDLMALNIQRGRDHGLPDFNTARRAYKLKPIEDLTYFKDKVPDKIWENLNSLYNGSVDNLDVWVGGLLETTKRGPGELFSAIITDQFQRIRDGDRFWYANINNGHFTGEEIQRIENLTVYDIIMSVTDMDHDDIQKNPFVVPLHGDNINSKCKLEKSTCLSMTTDENLTCYHLPLLNSSKDVEACSTLQTYDYFRNSEKAFIVTYLACGVLIIVFGVSLWVLGANKQRKVMEMKQTTASQMRESFRKECQQQITPYSVLEWVDHNCAAREVLLVLEKSRKQIQILNHRGQLLRAMDLTHAGVLQVFIIADGHHVMLRVTNDYDLVIKFEADLMRTNFLRNLEEFLKQLNVRQENFTTPLQPALRQAITRKARQMRLEKFFRVVFSQAFNISQSLAVKEPLSAGAAKEVIYTELTINEFAEALSMRADSEFVRKMFALVDKDHNGFISFREFLDMLVIFSKGTAEDKVKLMFDMYDINGHGKLTREDFKDMIKSLIETANSDVDQTHLDDLIVSMLRNAGLADKNVITLEDFQSLLTDYKDKLGYTQLNFPGIQGYQNVLPNRSTQFEKARYTVFSMYGGSKYSGTEREPLNVTSSIMPDQDITLHTKSLDDSQNTTYFTLVSTVANYSREIFWVTLYTLVVIAIFAERAYYYSVEREHTGLRRIAGYGVTITRGAASAMMFTYSTLLVTMCRNTITTLRNTALHLYVPFDRAVQMHKYIAVWAVVFTVIHIVGHAFNFYSISTQPSDDLSCLFRNFQHSTHEIPKFQYWCWQTITGVTGILLTLLLALVCIFSTRYARQHLYNAFWLIHSLYPIFYILMFLHGMGRLVQEPFMVYFFIGPCLLFTIDRFITVATKKVELPVVRAELLPSDVTLLEFKKPTDCEYKSGQWLRLACPALNTSEYHPFTISSAPHETNLTVHIRAVGPWTQNIRSLFDDCLSHEKPLPKVHIEGPFGESHQDWYRYETAVLIGGGIGVTPFASILKDIVFRANSNRFSSCKKVYFLWITKTQKQFEWLVDIIREVENADISNVVSVHIFITQFYHKFDLRTILLYICERHFQRICNHSLFTGLQAVTHFGRPDFPVFFRSLQALNQKVRKIGVFSCGPQPMTQSIDKVCAKINKETIHGPIFQHYFKNF
ncbi:dual oxidase-like [Schistocerca gregaria]|uniref:dual oxidase-like n=1 Tax=Schistocerca gregaria TaxID=7010 RepID=UPI00211E2254|nr:dual oxidase-like [Schistocerca gregaria]